MEGVLTMINVLVVDDHIAVTEGAKAILESSNEIKVDTLSPPYSLDSFRQEDYSKYDIVLMDINLGIDTNGLEVSKEILKTQPDSKIILYTGYDIEDYFIEAIKCGLYGAIHKNTPKQDFLNYIDYVLKGKCIISVDLLKRTVKEEEPEIEEEPKYTDRELKIIEYLGEGLTNQEISDRLYVSKRTVEYSLTEIFQKLGVSSRIEAVLIAKSEGLL